MKKILQTLTAVVATVAVTSTATAQIPDNGVWPSGVTVTDINGNVHDFDAILNSGKTIVLDAFADWCPPCWTYHQTHTLEDLWLARGPMGTDDVFVIGIEADPSEPESTISDPNSGQGDWTIGTTYAQANDDNIAGIINLGYYPTLITICPDRSVTETGQATLAAYNGYVDACPGLPTNTNDPRIIGQESDEAFCSGDVANMRAVVQNFGSAALTSATIEVFDGATSVLSYNWSGNLAQFEFATVDLGTVSPTAATTYTIKITSTNDDVSNDEVNASVAPAPVVTVNSTSKELTLVANIDAYASEVGFILSEGIINGGLVQTHNDAANGVTTPLGFIQVGSLADGTTNITETYTVNNEGCHTATFVDGYGDGVNYQTPGANVALIGNGAGLSVDPAYGDGVHVLMDISFTAALGIDEEAVSNLSAYPNPTNGITNITFEANGAASVEVINLAGQVVFTTDLGEVSGTQNVAIDASNFENGMYLVNVNTENGVATTRISVAK
ncbi:MAG: T9SS type A sorting domain-containing protein [Lishizhenia sp.]